jgi:hypothetical protein
VDGIRFGSLLVRIGIYTGLFFISGDISRTMQIMNVKATYKNAVFMWRILAARASVNDMGLLRTS